MSDQDPQSRNAARIRVSCFIDRRILDSIVIQIETEIPHYKVHKDHWGADILLRDQLKSLRDVAAKVVRKEVVRKGRKNNNQTGDGGLAQ